MKICAELQKEVENVPLHITGQVPNWLSGHLIRNGPVTVTINGKTNEHLFDGLAMLHAFAFAEGGVHYSNKFLRSEAYRAVFYEGSLHYTGFAIDPCRSLFKNFFTFLLPHSHPIHNANINVAKLADVYVALTEIPLPVQFDLHTLRTLGVLDYPDRLPKDACWVSAHPHCDHKQKSTLNYLITFGRKSYYLLHYLQDGSLERKVIAELPVEQPSYMHSFAVTENYIILTQFPLVVNPPDLIKERTAFIKNFTWQPQKGTQLLVVNRKTGQLVGNYATKPFFAFHHANAFEKGETIHLDIVTYPDASIIMDSSLYVDPAQENKTAYGNNQPTLERFSLSLKTGSIVSEILLSKNCEFPRINGTFDGQPYRFVYLVAFASNLDHKQEWLKSEGLYKFDTTTKQIWEWYEEDCSAGEPVFVPTPNAKEEDDGIVLAIIFDHRHNNSFLLILEAKSFTELGRARAPHPIPAGLHGQFFTSS